MTDFSKPQRMSFGAFVIYFTKVFRTFISASIIFIGIGIFNSDDGAGEILLRLAVSIGIVTAIALLVASAGYFQIRFHVEDGNLVYRHYIISRATTTIPLSRIHSLRTRRNLLYRLLKLRGVLFDTLAAKGAEIELILSESDWQSLINQIEQQEQPHHYTPDVPPPYDPSSTIKLNNDDLVLDALCQNHLKGMLVLGSFFAVIFNNLSEVSDDQIEMIAGYLESHVGSVGVSIVGVIIILAATYIISLVLWLGKVIFRYYGMKLSYNSKMLTFSHGLISRLTSRFAYDKICTLWIKRNFLEKYLGLCTISLKQALNASAQKDDDNLTIYGRDHSGFFLNWWLGQDFLSEPDIITAKSGRGVFTISIIIPLIISIASTIALCYYGYCYWIALPLAYLLLSIAKGICAMRRSHITLKQSYIIISNGRFVEIKNYLKFDNVEVVRLTRSPLSKLTGRVSLSLSTSGTTFKVRSLREEEALQIYELLLAKSIAYNQRL